MFSEVHDDGYTRHYLDEQLPCDFARRLLTELYALSTPIRAGITGAHAKRAMSTQAGISIHGAHLPQGTDGASRWSYRATSMKCMMEARWKPPSGWL